MARSRAIPWYRRPGFWGVTLLTTLLLVGISSIAYKAIRDAFPNMGVLRANYPWVEYQGKGKAPKVSLKRRAPPSWVGIQAISTNVIGAVIVSEDWSFFSHDGYDPHEIKNALQKDLKEGRFARGASTITQQVVKNVFLERDKTLWRKFREFVLSVELDDKVSKRRILEVYLNIVELGEGIYGVGPASRHYFGKHPSQLTAKEGAFLAMLLPSPKRYSQSFRDRRLTPYARKTIRNILRKMVRGRYIDQEQYEIEVATQLSFEIPEAPVLAEPSSQEEEEEVEVTEEEGASEPEPEGDHTLPPIEDAVAEQAPGATSETPAEAVRQESVPPAVEAAPTPVTTPSV
jgi:monofunctional biosynthetic peptidoglycan transglycosylase